MVDSLVIILDFIFDLLNCRLLFLHGFSLLITSCDGQGIDHPDSVAVKRKFSLSKGVGNGSTRARHHIGID